MPSAVTELAPELDHQARPPRGLRRLLCDIDAEALGARNAGRRLTHSAHIGLTANDQQMVGESWTVTAGLEDIVAGMEECTDPIEIEEKLELAERVVPCSGVVAADECGERGERLYLDVVFPPRRPENEAVAVAQLDRVIP